MKIALHSDLHLEHFFLKTGFLENDDFDVLVLAGDIVNTPTAHRLEMLRTLTDKPIIYIPGNHEYYYDSIEHADKMFENVCNEFDIHFAKNRIIRIGDTAFICCVGWSDMKSYEDRPHESISIPLCDMVADFRLIKNHTVDEMINLAELDKNFIINSLEMIRDTSPNLKTVIATHFSPLEAYNNDKFQISHISSYFANNWNDIVYEYEPAAWLYGHTHWCKNGAVYQTKVASNQAGYGKEHVNGYDPNFVIEV